MRSPAWHSVARTEARSVEHDNKAMLAEHFGVVTPLSDEGVGLLLDQERLVFDWISCSQKLGGLYANSRPDAQPELESCRRQTSVI